MRHVYTIVLINDFCWISVFSLTRLSSSLMIGTRCRYYFFQFQRPFLRASARMLMISISSHLVRYGSFIQIKPRSVKRRIISGITRDGGYHWFGWQHSLPVVRVAAFRSLRSIISWAPFWNHSWKMQEQFPLLVTIIWIEEEGQDCERYLSYQSQYHL